MRVRVNSLYRFDPCIIDIAHPPYNVSRGDIVRVKNLPGAPPANTMNHCHVVNPYTGEFMGLVCCASLEPASEATKRHIRKNTKRTR